MKVIIYLLVGALAAFATQRFDRAIPLKHRWIGFLGVGLAGVVMGLMTLPPIDEKHRLHGFESALSNHVFPATAGFAVVYLVTLGLRRTSLPPEVAIVAGAILFPVVSVTTSLLILVLM